MHTSSEDHDLRNNMIQEKNRVERNRLIHLGLYTEKKKKEN